MGGPFSTVRRLANTVAANPNGGKSWLAIKVAIRSRLAPCRRVLMLDFDNKRPSVLTSRAGDTPGRGSDNPEQGIFANCQGCGVGAAIRALWLRWTIQWLLAAEGPTFSTVIIDSDTAAFTVPNDGKDVLPWWKKHVTPWEAGRVGSTDTLPPAKASG